MSTFKRAKVVMLPTEKASPIDLFKDGNKVLLNNGYIKTINNQHLYILSDDEIKEGDWYYDSEFNSIHKSSFPDGLPPFLKRRCKKIIATTDESIHIHCISCNGKGQHDKDGYNECNKCNTRGYNYLPQPSQSFIEKYVEEYNKGQKIETVLVEYEDEIFVQDYASTPNSPLPPMVKLGGKWKINPKDNTITIKKVKDSWSREETVTLCLKMQHDYTKYKESCHYGPNMREIADWTDKWLEENL